MKKQRTRKWYLKLLSIVTSLVLIPLVVTSCALPPELDTANIVNQFFPNFWVFIAHIIALGILLMVMIFLLWKPTKRALVNRSALIQKDIDAAEKAEQEAQKFLQEANEKRLKADMEARQIVNLATHEGYRVRAEIEDNAKRSANRTIQNAKQELSRRENALREELHAEIIDIAINATQALIKKNIDRKDGEQFVEDFIKELEDLHFD